MVHLLEWNQQHDCRATNVKNLLNFNQSILCVFFVGVFFYGFKYSERKGLDNIRRHFVENKVTFVMLAEKGKARKLGNGISPGTKKAHLYFE